MDQCNWPSMDYITMLLWVIEVIWYNRFLPAVLLLNLGGLALIPRATIHALIGVPMQKEP